MHFQDFYRGIFKSLVGSEAQRLQNHQEIPQKWHFPVEKSVDKDRFPAESCSGLFVQQLRVALEANFLGVCFGGIPYGDI